MVPAARPRVAEENPAPPAPDIIFASSINDEWED
jgi:hypothetical protein